MWRNSLMAITDLNHFLKTYFSAHHCELLHGEDGVLTIQLTEEMGRALMNRPFYWHYVKSSGNTGTLMQLTLIKHHDKRAGKAERCIFGIHRLPHIITYRKTNDQITSKNL